MAPTIAVLLSTIPTLVAAPVPKAKNKRPDTEVFVGTWEAVVPGKDGQAWAKARWTIDDKLTLSIAYPEEDGRSTTWVVKLAPEKMPKEIDIGGSKGIYEFDGDSIRVACSSGERPTTFTPIGVEYYVLRRVESKKDK